MADLKANLVISLKDNFSNPFKKLQKSLGNVNVSFEKSSKKMNGFAKMHSAVAKVTKETTKVTEASKKAFDKAGNAVSKLGNKSKKSSNDFKDFHSNMGKLIASAGILAKIRGSITEAVSRENIDIALSSVAPKGSLNEFRSYFKQVEKTGIAAYGEIADTGYNLLSAGLEKIPAKLGAKTVIEVAKVTKGVSGDVASIMATTHKNFNEDMERVGDILTKTQLKFQFKDFNQLGEGFANTGSAAAAMNYRLADTATTLGMLNDAGITGASAGTALKGVLLKMATNEQKFGVKVTRREDGSLDMKAYLQQIKDAQVGLTDDQKSADLTAMFGLESVSGVLALINNLDKYSDALEDVKENSKGLTKIEAKKYYNSTEAQINKMRASYNQMSETMGKALIPVMNDLFKSLIPIVNGFASWMRKNPELAKNLLVVTTAIASFVAVTSTLSLIGAVIKPFASILAIALKFGKVAKLLVVVLRVLSLGFIKLGIAIMATPVGWIIMGIMAIATASYLIIKHWDKVKEFFGGIFSKIREYIKPFANWLNDFLITPIKNYLDILTKFYSFVFEGIKNGLVAVYNFLMDKVINPISTMFETVKSLFGDNKAEVKATTIAENKNTVSQVVKQESKSKNKEAGVVNRYNTFNINGSNLDANSIAELVISKLEQGRKTSYVN